MSKPIPRGRGTEHKRPKPIILDSDDLGWILAGSARTRMLKHIRGKVHTATTLAQKARVSQAVASKHLRAFAERGIVECLNPKARKGRVYRLTRKGQNLLKHL